MKELFAEIKEKYLELQEKLSKGYDKDASILISKYTELYEYIMDVESFREVIKEFHDMIELLNKDTESELIADAEHEVNIINKRINTLIRMIKVKYKILFDSDDDEFDNVNKLLVEIRSGVGGDEGALFANDLYRMYSMYFETKGWTYIVKDINSYNVQSGETAIKRIVLEVEGKQLYRKLKFESGIHRVIRNPITDASDRTHTSSATVAIIPVPDNIDIVIKDDEIEFTTCKSSGAGGQHVNVTDSAVMLTHKPSGLVVRCQDERSQGQNKAKALEELKARLYKMEKDKQLTDISQQRREMVGGGDYSSRIRTYNFKKQLFYDHRINYRTTDIYKIMDGQLDELIDVLEESFVLDGDE